MSYRNVGQGSGIRPESIQPLARIFAGLSDNIAQRTTRPELPTGISSLDTILWGLHRKQVLCIAARPSEGKTTLGLQIAWNLADAHFVVHFISLEMSKEQLVERQLCNTMNIHNTKLRHGQVDDTIKSKMAHFKTMLDEQKPKLLITDDVGYHYKQIEDLIDRLNPRPDVVMLDYIQLCTLGRHDSKVEAISEYVRALKQLAVEKNIAIVILSQINRGIKDRADKRPRLEELKGSGCILGSSLVMGRPIKEIYERKLYFPVASLDVQTGAKRGIMPSSIVDTGTLNCYRLKTKGGKEIVASEATKFLTRNGWIAIKDLRCHDYIVVEHTDTEVNNGIQE